MALSLSYRCATCRRRGGGSTVREDKKCRRILILPPATEPTDGRGQRDSQGILVFPFRTTPRRERRGRRGRGRAWRARPARSRWLERALCSPQESAFPCLPPRQRSLRTAVHDEKVEDAAFCTGSASPPRSAARWEPAGSAARRAPRSWLTGARATGMVMCRESPPLGRVGFILGLMTKRATNCCVQLRSRAATFGVPSTPALRRTPPPVPRMSRGGQTCGAAGAGPASM